MWKLLSHFSRNKTNISGPSGEEFVEHYTKLAIAPKHDTFDDTFETEINEFLKKYDDKEAFPCIVNKMELDILNKDFTRDEILSCIDSLKNQKAAGIDSIPAEFVKVCKEELVDNITLII